MTRTALFVTSVAVVCAVMCGTRARSWDAMDSETVWDEKVVVSGLGWRSPQLPFNSRYFFVENASVSDVSVVSAADDCRLWLQVLNDTDLNAVKANLTIVRYKIISDVCRDGLQLRIFGADRRLLAERTFGGHIYGESCVCRRNDWNRLMKCDQMSHQFRQINDDLSTFNTSDGIDFDVVLNETKRRFSAHTRSYSFCHYQIINNEAFRRCYGEYVGFSQFIDEIVESLLRKTNLPDMEFIANLGDWPLSDKRTEPALPIFSWCGSTDTHDIVIPTYELTESSIHMQGRISLDILSVFGKQSIPLKAKKNTLFWRGRDSNEVRLKLVKLGKNNSDLINASLTNFFFFRDKMDEYGPISPYISFFDFFGHKYQINIDGTVAAYRFPYLLAGNSFVIKQDSKFYEFFYQSLKAGVHYIPIDIELNNLIEILGDLSEREQQFEPIIQNMRLFVLENLLPEHIYCYYFNLFIKYSTLLKKKVILMPQMEKVSKNGNQCDCKDILTVRDEL